MPAVHRELFESFGDDTTFHAFRYVIGSARKLWGRIFWALFVVPAIGACTWTVASTFLQYYAFNTSTTIEYVPIGSTTDDDAFPSVTICNAGSMYRDIVTNMQPLYGSYFKLAGFNETDAEQMCYAPPKSPAYYNLLIE